MLYLSRDSIRRLRIDSIKVATRGRFKAKIVDVVGDYEIYIILKPIRFQRRMRARRWKETLHAWLIPSAH